MFQDFTAVSLGQMQVEQEKCGAWNGRIAVQIVDEGDNLVPVDDDVELTVDLVFAQRVPHKAHIRRVILGENNMTG
jgi:hypothetical protein